MSSPVRHRCPDFEPQTSAKRDIRRVSVLALKHEGKEANVWSWTEVLKYNLIRYCSQTAHEKVLC
jgi:hypothetical protein